MEFKELLAAFAAKYGVEGLDGADGAAELDVDGIRVELLDDPQAQCLFACSEIGHPPPDANGAFGAMMLQANFLFEATKGATLFQNPDSKSFGLQQQYRLVYLDVDTLAAEVEKLANMAEDWKDILSGCKASETAVDARTEEESAFPTTGLLQV